MQVQNFDSVNYDEYLTELLQETGKKNQFENWLNTWLRIPEMEEVWEGIPLEIKTWSESFRQFNGIDVDIDILTVEMR